MIKININLEFENETEAKMLAHLITEGIGFNSLMATDETRTFSNRVYKAGMKILGQIPWSYIDPDLQKNWSDKK